ncbi:MAG: methyltransferase domain-containing protein [Chloroflexi bacterium]|nr:methyltransferase domain-containing protein [Chloroflexota bacterium]MBV9894111.1 methyltransferase domain-containing protein [Chloroflexota bacterium]
MAELACPVCGGSESVGVLEEHAVPVHQNLICATPEDARAVRRGDLDIRACAVCGFVSNRAFDESLLEYGPRYDNTQLASPSFQTYVANLVSTLLERDDVRNGTIVEVGCGKGAFIRALVEAPGAQNKGLGFDPSYTGPLSVLGGRLRFERRFFEASSLDVRADVLICRHVIEHVTRPMDLLATFVAALREQSGGRVFLETPSVEWILRNRVIWDLFYEHCSLFTPTSLASACSLSGLSVQTVSSTFGDQYIWLEATTDLQPRGRLQLDAHGVPDVARAFAAEYDTKVSRWKCALDNLQREHRLALWGAGAKGSTFANLVDPDRERFVCLVDMNPAKQGAFLGGTGHPIVSPRELAQYGATAACVLNPNYVEEIRQLVDTSNLRVEVLELGDV